MIALQNVAKLSRKLMQLILSADETKEELGLSAKFVESLFLGILKEVLLYFRL